MNADISVYINADISEIRR